MWPIQSPYGPRRIQKCGASGYFGSRAKGTHRPDSDIDIAVELEPVGDSEETLVRWTAHSTQWEAQLQSRIAAKIDLEWFDPDGSTRRVQAALSEGKGLMYERTS
jgi:uncharacterized protein